MSTNKRSEWQIIRLLEDVALVICLFLAAAPLAIILPLMKRKKNQASNIEDSCPTKVEPRETKLREV